MEKSIAATATDPLGQSGADQSVGQGSSSPASADEVGNCNSQSKGDAAARSQADSLSRPDCTDSKLESPLRSVHTSNLPAILTHLNASLLVSTYQAGKLILVRSDGQQLNTHFRPFSKPMGVALAGNRLAIGGALDIWEYHNVPAAARAKGEDRLADACFLPRRSHTTGDIQIHEMEWGKRNFKDESDSRLPGQEEQSESQADGSAPADTDLWFVNTRFSCLCTRSEEHSFVPQWRPPFISSYTPEDRCHLNGLCMADGLPKYATALGESDRPGGWREDKAAGGILMDVPSGEIVARGLSMPHSPRLYDQKLWVLNSGDGGIGTVDGGNGQYQGVAHLPGFTRGLCFGGRFAFVGLSQVRESAVFSGIKIAEKPEDERWSGVGVVDIIRGEVVAWLRFEDAVQEVFAVTLLPDWIWPDLINDDAELIGSAYVLPDQALNDVPANWRSPGARGSFK